MAKRELLAFEAPTATSGGGTIYPATQTGASLAGTAASTGVVAVKGASIAWRAVIVASLLVAGTATISVGIAAAVVLGTDGKAYNDMLWHFVICDGYVSLHWWIYVPLLCKIYKA